jgi:hypothetical protein
VLGTLRCQLSLIFHFATILKARIDVACRTHNLLSRASLPQQSSMMCVQRLTLKRGDRRF